MAVYTDVSETDLQLFIADYDIGQLLSYKGIAEGVENSNFLLSFNSHISEQVKSPILKSCA